MKPSYGRVSRYGLVAFASSLDQIGPLTHTVEDAATLLQIIAGHDPLDSTSLNEPVPDFSATINDGVKGLKIGLPKQYFAEGLDPAIEALVREAAAKLVSQGAELVEIDLPCTETGVAIYYILAPAEAASNLSRFDGIRYGKRSSNATDIIDTYRKSREEGFGEEVQRRILLGTYVLSSGYCDAYYTRAQKARTLVQREFSRKPSKRWTPFSRLPLPIRLRASFTRLGNDPLCRTTLQTSTPSPLTWRDCPPSPSLVGQLTQARALSSPSECK